MKINTTRVWMVLTNKAIPAIYLGNEIGISRFVIEKVRDDESEFKNLTLDVVTIKSGLTMAITRLVTITAN